MSISMLQGLYWNPDEFSVQELGYWFLAHFGYIVLAGYYFENRWNRRYYVFPRYRQKKHFFQSIWRGLVVITIAYNAVIFLICNLLLMLEGSQIPMKKWVYMIALTFFSEIALSSIQTCLCALVERHIIIYISVVMYEVMGLYSFMLGKIRLLFIVNYSMLIRCKEYSGLETGGLLFTFSESLAVLIFICIISYLAGNKIFKIA